MTGFARAALALGALGLAVWAGGQLRVAILVDRGDYARAARSTRSTEPELRLAQARLFARDRAGAEAPARTVVAREPENAAGWAALALALRGRDPAGEREALARVRALRPPVPASPP